MKPETSQVKNVHFRSEGWDRLVGLLNSDKVGRCFLLTDTNTQRDCLDLFYKLSRLDSSRLEILTVPAGEKHKNLDTCLELWNSLSDLGADRSSVLVNLGGGVVTDMGGFVASTYQRGIRFVNIPTSLLAMVDASIGGKNGVDLGNLKNQVGIIREPEFVLIDPGFLSTLDQDQLLSGQAEMFKHGLIHSADYWNAVKEFDVNDLGLSEKLILESVVIKDQIVTEDPTEKGIRKALNFGHTLGHAIETHCLESEDNRGHCFTVKP
ncbi:3-dehydroquinate synthase [Aureitalea marina]|uniref:3-dehydroquinate synthase n=1 Tax=Aureitalea marina TaxID=930804 RepID=UPI00248280DD|nr:3-dehydroquinate synthase family protein [Aureitalea marina]